jgi:hypothetical protein
MRVIKLQKSAGNGNPRTERKLISYKQALEELKTCYNAPIEKIKKYLDKGTQLGNGLGTFYQITQERR